MSKSIKGYSNNSTSCYSSKSLYGIDPINTQSIETTTNTVSSFVQNINNLERNTITVINREEVETITTEQIQTIIDNTLFDLTEINLNVINTNSIKIGNILIKNNTIRSINSSNILINPDLSNSITLIDQNNIDANLIINGNNTTINNNSTNINSVTTNITGTTTNITGTNININNNLNIANNINLLDDTSSIYINNIKVLQKQGATISDISQTDITDIDFVNNFSTPIVGDVDLDIINSFTDVELNEAKLANKINLLIADVNNLRTSVNALISRLKDHGLIAP